MATGPDAGARPAGARPAGAPADHEEDLRERPLGELLKQLADQTSTLMRQEIELAKAETTQKAKIAGAGAGLIGAGAIIALLGAGALTAFLILILDLLVASWLSALIIGLILVAIAGALAIQGRNRIQRATPPVPQQTVETVKEDVEWAKTQAGSARR